MTLDLGTFLTMMGNLEGHLEKARRDPSYLKGVVRNGNGTRITRKDEVRCLYGHLMENFGYLPEEAQVSGLLIKLKGYGRSLKELTRVLNQLDSTNGHIGVN